MSVARGDVALCFDEKHSFAMVDVDGPTCRKPNYFLGAQLHHYV